MIKPVRTAIFPVAGLSTRFLPVTDAIAAEIGAGRPVHGFRFDGERFDCGAKAGFPQANVAFALSRPDLRDAVAPGLRAMLGSAIAAE